MKREGGTRNNQIFRSTGGGVIESGLGGSSGQISGPGMDS